MLSKVRTFIDKHNLLEANGLYLVALSGGADSVALLLMLVDMGWRVEAVHCNFRLRGAESDRDEQFCQTLCNRLGVVLHRAHFDTRAYAELHKVSIEMAARELRYRYFEQLRRDVGASGICVAHHRDDSVETVLLNLVRGTGLRGLTGIRPRNGYILRPLLCLSRSETEAFLRDRGQDYVTDSTNMEDDALRNKVRHHVLPLLKTLNPAVADNVQRTAENVAEAQLVLDAVMKDFEGVKSLETSSLDKYGSSEYIVFEWLKNYGFNGSQARATMEAETGKVFTSPTGYDLLVDRGRLLVEPSLKPMKPMVIPETGTYLLDDTLRLTVAEEAVSVSKSPERATLDWAKVALPLTVRRVEAGDSMVPYGMSGRKLLSDLMTDRKMSLFDKRRQLVVVDARGVIVWLVGLRVDARVAVSASTERVLALSVSPSR